MKVRIIRSYMGREGASVRQGSVVDVPHYRAEELQKKGLGVPLLDGVRPIYKKPTPAAVVVPTFAVKPTDAEHVETRVFTSEVAEQSAPNPRPLSPTLSPVSALPTGSPTGEAKPVLLSPRVRRPRKRTSSKRKGEPE